MHTHPLRSKQKYTHKTKPLYTYTAKTQTPNDAVIGFWLQFSLALLEISQLCLFFAEVYKARDKNKERKRCDGMTERYKGGRMWFQQVEINNSESFNSDQCPLCG